MSGFSAHLPPLPHPVAQDRNNEIAAVAAWKSMAAGGTPLVEPSDLLPTEPQQ